MTALCLVQILSSCYEDLSTEADTTIPEITISYPEESISIFFGDTLRMSPDIYQRQRSAGDFDYMWEIDLTTSHGTKAIIGEGPSLEFPVNNSPSIEPYTLMLEVTDRQTGLKCNKVWPLYVMNPFGEGLLVAYTRDGGASSELDLVRDVPITYGYQDSEPRYARNLYAKGNDGAQLKGRINCISDSKFSESAVYNLQFIMLCTEDHLIGLDPTSYKVSRTDSQFFDSYKESSFNSTYLRDFGTYGSIVIMNGGVPYTTLNHGSATYNKMVFKCNGVDKTDLRGQDIAWDPDQQGTSTCVNTDDGQFYSTSSFLCASSGFQHIEYEPKFDYKGGICLGSNCINYNSKYSGGHLVKKDSGLYAVIITYSNSQFVSVLELEVNGPDMDKAIGADFADNGSLFFYCTNGKVYSNVVMASGVTTRDSGFKPEDSRELITGVKHYKQACVGKLGYYPETRLLDKYSHKLMIVTTYNPSTKEGKVYLNSYSVATGLFTKSVQKVYSGYGEIEFVEPTFR